jgi:hypothetical protein
MLHVAFAGTFPASLEQPVRRYLTIPCEIVVTSEADILPKMPKIDVLVTMGLTAEMARAATRLKLVQVPGAGVDRIDRSALPGPVQPTRCRLFRRAPPAVTNRIPARCPGNFVRAGAPGGIGIPRADNSFLNSC